MTESLLHWIATYGYSALFAALMFGIAGLPIPDETILVFCGYLISQHRLDPFWTYVVGVAGSVSGISLSYVLGRTGGSLVVERYGKFVHLTPARVALVNRWFHRMGEWLLFFGYFILGVRHFTALVAGMSGLEYRIFARYAYLGAALWVATFLGIGYLVGDHWEQALGMVHHYSWALLIGIVLAIAVILFWRYRQQRRQA